MTKIRMWAVILILGGAFAGYFTYGSEKGIAFKTYPFKFGLDLKGGTHLIYQADVSKTAPDDVAGSMQSLRNTIEQRINIFGVSEPIVQVEEAKIGSTTVQKLIVELPGVTDISKAIETIGKTPLLEFKLTKEVPAPKETTTSTNPLLSDTSSSTVPATTIVFEDTPLTGKYLKHADIVFNPTTNQPAVSISFNDEGTKLFADITRANVGRVVAIFLDGNVISAPTVREEIRDGKAEISGNFKIDDAKKLVQELNFGALPLPVTLIGSQTIGASLGEDAINASVAAGLWSFAIISLFLILYYRLPGVVAVIALIIYTALNLSIFKLIPVTLTSAGLAGFILSIGMAVDANILIFERTKEELRKGLELPDAIKEGFHRAWLSIRDSNLSSIITAVILYYFATSSLIKGFALVFVIGVLTSMFTAITVSRTLLRALGVEKTNKITKFLFGNGFMK